MNAQPIRVLLIEDNPGDARLLHDMLNEPGAVTIELTHFGCMSDSLVHLATHTTNIILLDLGLPDADGLGAVRQVHAVSPSTPLVVLTGLDDEALAVQALQEGAQDYLVKGQIETHALLRALRYAIERQRTQVETDQARRLQLQLKDEFFSHVSHELRSPLTAIHQFGNRLADELAGGVTTNRGECLQIILRNVGQLQAMIGDLLEVTRAQDGKLTMDLQCASISDAVSYVAKTLQITAKKKGIALSLDLPQCLPLVYADPARIRQILVTLLDNAVKFTRPGGAVTVRARPLSEDPNFLLLEVEDSGCGISPDMTERIFERLFQGADREQSAGRGLGLGLYICKELVDRQGGRVWVTSPPQQGSIFSFTLPVFSLPRLLSTLLKQRVWPADSVALVTAEIRPPESWLSEGTRDEWAREARSVLQRCMLPDLDLLLPKMGTSGTAELFQAIAFADERGAAVLIKRIREQFRRLKHCQESNLTFSVSYSREPASAGPGAREDDLVAAMAARVEKLLGTESLARAPQV